MSPQRASPMETSSRSVKFDRQIVAIAKVEGAKVIYSNDEDIGRFSVRDNLEVVRLDQLPSPPENQQAELLFPAPPEDDAP
jgi:hypothetical protein